MKISELVKSGTIEPGQILRDGEFSTIGFLTHTTVNKLCFIQSEKTLGMFSDFAGVSCVVTTPELSEMIADKYPWGIIVSELPSITFYDINNHLCDRGFFFYNTKFPTSIHPSAKIYPEAIVYDQGVIVGPDCIIEPGAIICPGAILGTGVVIRCGTVISSEGYQYYYGRNGKRIQVKHGGPCIINSDVEIKPNSIIDRGVLSVSTEIGSGTKIDAKVHFGHNVKCGVDCMIVGGTTISGNVTIGDYVWIGPGSTISSNINIGNHAYIALGSVVTRNILLEEKVSGNFAISHDKNIQHLKGIR
jgi:UDP-3-O-[3-hydroxymyristoyl] glucosamine N-acyltransferase